MTNNPPVNNCTPSENIIFLIKICVLLWARDTYFLILYTIKQQAHCITVLLQWGSQILNIFIWTLYDNKNVELWERKGLHNEICGYESESTLSAVYVRSWLTYTSRTERSKCVDEAATNRTRLESNGLAAEVAPKSTSNQFQLTQSNQIYWCWRRELRPVWQNCVYVSARNNSRPNESSVFSIQLIFCIYRTVWLLFVCYSDVSHWLSIQNHLDNKVSICCGWIR